MWQVGYKNTTEVYKMNRRIEIENGRNVELQEGESVLWLYTSRNC